VAGWELLVARIGADIVAARDEGGHAVGAALVAPFRDERPPQARVLRSPVSGDAGTQHDDAPTPGESSGGLTARF
jgi:hypothetical protein